MGGYHIAEALGIPYFRAFTMTWTRTRLVLYHIYSILLTSRGPEHTPMLSPSQSARSVKGELCSVGA